MQVCLQLMKTHLNSLALDQLATLAHGLTSLHTNKQIRLLQEAIAVLCNTRGDQLSVLSVEHKIYLLKEFGCKLQYTGELLESLWNQRADLQKWQQAVGFFLALSKTSVRSDSQRHDCLEQWCMDIVWQQYEWMGVDDIEALLAAFVRLGTYDGELFRVLGDHSERQSSNWTSRLSVWNLLADADYLHVGLTDRLLTDLSSNDIEQLSVDMQLSLLAFLAEAVNHYRTHCIDTQQHSDGIISTCVKQLSRTLQTPENVPAGK